MTGALKVQTAPGVWTLAQPGGLDQATGDARYVNVTGDTMTGVFSIDGASPALRIRSAGGSTVFGTLDGDSGGLVITSDQAATEINLGIAGGYDFTVGASVNTSANPIVLPGDPTSALHATTKQYVDARGVATSWTPVMSTTGTAYNNGTTGTAVGWYARVEDLVHAQFVILAGGTGITKGTGTYSINLPVAPKPITGSGVIVRGLCQVTDSGTGVRTFGLVVATDMTLVPINTTYAAATAITDSTLGIATLGAGDSFAGSVIYQA